MDQAKMYLGLHSLSKWLLNHILLDFSLTVKALPHECVIRTGQPKT